MRNAIQIIIAALVVVTTAGHPDSNPVHPKIGINPFTPQGRIVGGQPAPIERHPWQVSLQTYGFHFCGGSIISESVILTAAHCTTSYPAGSINVRVGSSRTSSGGALHQVAEIVRHENYRTNLFGIPVNDIALLKLRVPIKVSRSAEPVQLYARNERIAEGTPATISGWGTLREGGTTPDVLYTVDVPIVSKSECSKAYASFGGIPENQICAAYPFGGKDTCQGDSGGPLVVGGRQAGIVSWGNGCARRGYPGVYTEIAAHRQWLARHANV